MRAVQAAVRRWWSRWGPGRSAARRIVTAWALSRLGLVLAGWVALGRLPWQYYSPAYNLSRWPWILMWVRWDALWYIAIAQHGYWLRALAFFPFYPLTIAALHWATGLSYPWAAVAIANAFLLAALFALYGLVRETVSRTCAERAVWSLLAYPTAFFASAAYTEGPFLGLSLFCFWTARRGQLWWAAVWAALAAMTRNEGIFTAIAWAYAYWRRHGWRYHPEVWSGLIIPAGLLAFMGYQWTVFHDPLAFIAAQSYWGRHITWPWVGLWLAIKGIAAGNPLQPGTVLSMMDVASGLGSMALWGYAWRQRFPGEWLSYWGILLVIDLAAPQVHGASPLLSLSRLVVILFPAYAALGQLSRRAIWRRGLAWTLPALQATLVAVYATWHWVA
ncbi:MAG: hypothetical protein K6U14_08575 [Firmicutes bacterium]|nr:hypothetical protein [Alicyclobacillaceae bacterium]MCL6497663.1 hypothetical protein [Bacillota bacterium]